MKVSVSESVMDLIEKLRDETPSSVEDRPSVDDIQKVHVIGKDELEESETYVEIFMEIHQNGDAAEPLTIEFHPHRHGVTSPIPGVGGRGKETVRILQQGRLDEHEKEQYRVFGAVVGGLAYHEP